MRLAPIAIFAVAVASCNNLLDSGPVKLVGTYTLEMVDAAPLPFRAASALTVRGAVSLNNDGRYTWTQADSATTGGVSMFSSSGHWTVQENALELADDAGPLQLGIVVPDTVTIDFRDHRNVYVRH